ncbi:carboxymuconolactone decarboxylase family protein [Rhodococcus koreensis]|nr:carboxymuconolactone decarboxylase family protein [Rhodococcus koreensis]
MGAGIWRDNILPPLWIELLCIAGDAALTHMYSPGTRRHIATALALGADRAQIDEVLRIVAEQGQESYEFALPILEQELRNQAVGV